MRRGAIVLKKPHRLKVWKDARGEFRWHIKAKNGEITAASTEGFMRYRSLLANLRGAVALHGLPLPPVWPHGGLALAGKWENDHRSHKRRGRRTNATVLRWICRRKAGDAAAGSEWAFATRRV